MSISNATWCRTGRSGRTFIFRATGIAPAYANARYKKAVLRVRTALDFYFQKKKKRQISVALISLYIKASGTFPALESERVYRD